MGHRSRRPTKTPSLYKQVLEQERAKAARRLEAEIEAKARTSRLQADRVQDVKRQQEAFTACAEERAAWLEAERLKRLYSIVQRYPGDRTPEQIDQLKQAMEAAIKYARGFQWRRDKGIDPLVKPKRPEHHLHGEAKTFPKDDSQPHERVQYLFGPVRLGLAPPRKERR